MAHGNDGSDLSSTPMEPTGRGCGKGAAGCVVGCGGLVLLFLLIVGGAAWWLIRPGTQHPTTAVVGPQSAGAFRVGDLADDPGARAALEELLRAVDEKSPSTFASDDSPFWRRDGSDPRAAARVLRMLLPKEGTLSFEPVPDQEEPAAVLALNIRGMTKLLRALVEADRDTSEVYRGVTLARAEGGDAFFAMVDGTLLIADERTAARTGVDRLLDGTSQEMHQRLQILEEPEGRSLFLGSMDTEEGLLARSLQAESGEGEAREAPPSVDPEALEAVERLEISVDSLSGDAIVGRVGLAAGSPLEAEEAASAMAELLKTGMRPATVTVRPEIRDDDAVLHFEISDWIDPIATELAGEKAETPESPGPGREPAD